MARVLFKAPFIDTRVSSGRYLELTMQSHFIFKLKLQNTQFTALLLRSNGILYKLHNNLYKCSVSLTYFLPTYINRVQ